ncbi:erythromycin esterase family protein [Xanthocytophaga flava]|uniref:erythromycin esterase family protein n=1 Tax=Xanthocytophaga flava TaxID=3048013 RepID=UPI0028D31BC7|nr:erythromycin esterase family protein [Xanthocytophaga flavus]MDJ1471025.1 erythromycin esterase family protein [Xanthocytophaga flavus]
MLLFVRGKLYLFLSVSVFFIFSPLFAQFSLNLEFEPYSQNHLLLPLWDNLKDVSLQYDTVIKYTGKGSLLLNAEKPVNHGSLWTNAFITKTFKNNIISISFWARSNEFNGYVYLTATSSNNQSSFFSHVVKEDSTIGFSWKKVQLDLPFSAQAEKLSISIGFMGKGKVWIDHCQIISQDKEYQDIPFPGSEIIHDSSLSFYEPDLSFENSDKNRRLLKQINIQADSINTNRDRKSLKVQKIQPANSVLLQAISLDTLWGKTISIKGTVKNSSFKIPSMYISFFTEDKRFNNYWELYEYKEFPIQQVFSSNSEKEWQEFYFETPIPSNTFVRYASIGIVTPDSSIFWLDNILITIDGKKISSEIPPSPPTLAETSWLKKAIIPLKSTSPSEPLTDLLALNERIGKAKIIGLGENTHGSHETFQMKHRLIRWLVEQKGYNVIAFEADMAASEAVNEYVLNGKSDAQKVLKELGFWTWNVEEILALITWMRQYNMAHPKQMVQFKGFDMQSPWKALASLKEYLPAKDTLTWHSLKKRMERVVAIRRFVPATDTSIVAALQALREVKTTFLIRVAKHSLSQKAVIEQYFRQIEQVIELRLVGEANKFRDACMAENLYRTFTSIPDARILVWAHNNHVAKVGFDFPMGYWLKNQLGDSYQAIGFTFDQGTFRGIYKDSLQAATAQTSVAGSFESYFKTTQVPLFYLPLHKVPLVKENQWLHQRLLFRDVGAESFNDDFTRHSLLTEFDGLLFLQQSTPSRAVKNSSK